MYFHLNQDKKLFSLSFNTYYTENINKSPPQKKNKTLQRGS